LVTFLIGGTGTVVVGVVAAAGGWGVGGVAGAGTTVVVGTVEEFTSDLSEGIFRDCESGTRDGAGRVSTLN
jgi:hypothetical protein